jgi:predicted RNA binding protein YcfA (HicA-like mRNA interferase family)
MNPEIWDQLKNITADEIINALQKDGWELRSSGGGSSRRIYIKNKKLVSIHYHPHKEYGRGMLRDLLRDVEWTEQDLKRLKLIK